MKTAFEIIEDTLLNKHLNVGQSIEAAVAAGYTDEEAKQAFIQVAKKHVAPFDGELD